MAASRARDTANDGEASTLVASRSRLNPKWMHSPGSPDQLPRVNVRDLRRTHAQARRRRQPGPENVTRVMAATQQLDAHR